MSFIKMKSCMDGYQYFMSLRATLTHLLFLTPYSIYMRVSHHISLSYLTMVSNSILKEWETLILFLNVGGEASRFERLKVRNEIGVWLEMFFPLLSPKCRVGGQIGCGLELLLQKISFCIAPPYVFDIYLVELFIYE